MYNDLPPPVGRWERRRLMVNLVRTRVLVFARPVMVVAIRWGETAVSTFVFSAMELDG